MPERNEQTPDVLLKFKINVACHRAAAAEMKRSSRASAEYRNCSDVIQKTHDECRRLSREFFALFRQY